VAEQEVAEPEVSFSEEVDIDTETDEKRIAEKISTEI